jgi:hypothetical protein
VCGSPALTRYVPSGTQSLGRFALVTCQKIV